MSFSFLTFLQNSVDGKLNTPQLRLAYAALVRSAGASSFTSGGAPDDMYTLAWYCVQLILDTIEELSPQTQNSKANGKANARTETEAEDDTKTTTTDRVHRLHLMLISTISSLPLALMLRALEEARRLITAYPADSDADGVGAVDAEEETGKGGKAELLEALFDELLEKTGDREKETAMRWWYKYRPELISEKASMKGEEEKGTFLSWFKHRRADEMGLNEVREPKDATVGEETSGSPNATLSRL